MSARPARHAEGALRVATLNAGTLIEPDWDRRRHEVLAWLDRLDADVVCLQEIWEDGSHENTAAWLVAQQPAGRWHWCFGGFPFPPELTKAFAAVRPGVDGSLRFGSAVLSRWPIEQHALHLLPIDDTPGIEPFFRLPMELLHARTNGIDVYSTHLAPPPHQGYHRVRQVQFADETIKATRDPRAVLPPVLCGDFNAEPDSDEIRYLGSLAAIDGRSTYYQEAWRAAGNTDPGFTQDHRTNPYAAMLNVPIKRLDYVFVGDAFRRPRGAGLVLSAALAFHEQLTGVCASDHFGVVAEIRWPQREG